MLSDPALILGDVTYPAPSDPWNLDQYRCAEVDGEGDRCQLVIGHDGQHVLQKVGQLLTWPIGAEPQTRPPWATAFPRNEDQDDLDDLDRG